jgi:hypothetical protein
VTDPVGFTNAFGMLEQAIGDLVGAGDIKERLEIAATALVPIFPDDFPAGHLRDEYADIRQALARPPPEKGSGQGLPESTLEAMTEEEAGELAKSLFSLYTSAAEAVYGGGVRRLARALGPFTAPRLQPDGRGDLQPEISSKGKIPTNYGWEDRA